MFTLNLSGRCVVFERPAVMAIINATPDSFYAGSRTPRADAIAARTLEAVDSGADIIDLGAYSSRPGGDDISPAEELDRLLPAIEAIRSVAPDIPLSIDTFRADVARRALAAGADIVNDISGGTLDAEMFPLIASTDTPYILMHMRGTPQTMQQHTDYRPDGVAAEVMRFLAERSGRLLSMGATQVIVDPGFGFAKTVEQNWALMSALPLLRESFALPLLVGISRKSMFYRPLQLTADDVLPATCMANTLALQAGADILRVHDVAAARQIADLMPLLPSGPTITPM